MLDNWIAEERGQRSTVEDAPISTVPSPDAEIRGRIDRLQRSLRVMHVLVATALTAAAFSAYAVFSLPQAPTETPVRVCHHDGRQHSLGSMVRMPDNAIYECGISGSPARGASWQPTRNLGSGGKRR